jgi:zinc D-Ala-D-Ala carboxypeptidase
MTTQLTEHFTLEEFTASDTAAQMGNPNTPPEHERANLDRLAAVMEQVRTLLGDVPILVSSGYRCPEVNAACGGAEDSAHMGGLACDFTAPSYGSAFDVCVKLQPHIHELGIDQLIYEYDSWVHLGLSEGEPRAQCFTINDSGTTVIV